MSLSLLIGTSTVLLATSLALPAGAQTATSAKSAPPTQAGPSARPPPKSGTDHSGRAQRGEASFYANKFKGRTMADGQRMHPEDDNAASKTLPLGSTARVTNLETGQSATVTIQDRGPYVDGRIVDLSPATARQIGISKQDGVAPVEVAPIAVPLPDGSVKAGEGAQAGR